MAYWARKAVAGMRKVLGRAERRLEAMDEETTLRSQLAQMQQQIQDLELGDVHDISDTLLAGTDEHVEETELQAHPSTREQLTQELNRSEERLLALQQQRERNCTRMYVFFWLCSLLAIFILEAYTLSKMSSSVTQLQDENMDLRRQMNNSATQLQDENIHLRSQLSSLVKNTFDKLNSGICVVRENKQCDGDVYTSDSGGMINGWSLRLCCRGDF